MAYTNFNYPLAIRSQGVTPDMYSDDPEEAKRMMYEDLDARWKQDKSGFQRGMTQQGALERKQGGGQQQQSRPRAATGNAVAQANAMGDAPLRQHPQAAQHFGAQNAMIAQTNAAIAREMESRRKQAENERDRQHEYEMASMRQKPAAQPEQGVFGGGFDPGDEARKARNRSLLGMAGMGGHTIRGDQNGVSVTPHSFFGPMAKSLLG